MKSTLINSADIDQRVSLRFVVFLLAIVFAATHGWVLLSWNALFWDDWSILTADADEIRRMFKFVGFDLTGVLHAGLVPLGAGAYKILMLSSLALMSLCVFLIARHHGFKAENAGWITALFIVAPLNTSKIAAINVAAVMFAAIFFVAWALLLRDLQKPSVLKRIGVLVLFSIAFYLPSSLAFFALPAMSIAWHAHRAHPDWSERFVALFKRADFFVLPFVQFAIFRIFFFKPDASIANEYHKFGIRSSRLQEAIDRIQADILFDMPWAVRIVLIVLPFVVLLRLTTCPPAQHVDMVRRADVWIFIGLSACFFALLPYLAVGRLPLFSDWNSRYQLFLPLGFALVCWSMSQYIGVYVQRRWLGISTLALILVLSAEFSVRSYFEYAKDWQKQNQLMAALQELKAITHSDNIVIVDSVVYAKRRVLRYNEYTQMMMRAQPGWSGLALSNNQLLKVADGSLKQYIATLGEIKNIQAEPKLFGLSSNWRWNDSCVVLVAFEINGRIQLRRGHAQTLAQSPCVLKSADNY